ncbi:MAG: glutathione S-transferase family protein [Pseudomonadota bacterium]
MRVVYHMPLSPFCRKLRLVLAEKRVEVELHDEKPWERRIEFLRLNPAGTVPVYVDGRDVYADSNAVAEYLDEVIPDPPLLPKSATDRAEARRLVAWFDDKFHREVTENLIYERVNKRLRKSGYPDSARIKAGIANIKFHLDYLDWLTDRRKWLAGDQLSLADFAAAAHLSCLDFVGDVDWSRSQPVKDWYARIKSRPAFRTLLTDSLPGFQPPAHYADLDF